MNSAKEKIVILDNLSTGIISNIPKSVEFVEGSITDSKIIEATIDRYSISGIINLAALKSVAESEVFPEKYELINHLGVRTLIKQAKSFGIEYFIQPSTATVYGNSTSGFVSEQDKLSPMSQYGKSKASAETELNDAIDTRQIKGLSEIL